MIAVVGATGNTGRALVKELRALGEQPLAVVRNPEKARDVLGPDTKVAVAELTDRAALDKALKGVTRLFLLTGNNPQMAEQHINVLDAAQNAGVKFLVRLSGGRDVAVADSETIVGRAHYAVEQKLRASGLSWVILRPGLFMQNTFGQAALIKNDSKMALPFAKDLPLAFIDVRDSGVVAARILADPAPHAGKTYEFTGALTSYGAFAEVFSNVLGRPIAYVATTLEQAEQAMKARGLPDWMVTHQLAIAKLAAKGSFSAENTKPIRDIAGRAPLTARQFVEDHKAMFA
ncbi:MAG: NAD(P)H-binding protein [Propylenella sp.]